MCYLEQDGDDAAGASEEQKSADRGSRQTEGMLGSVKSSWVTLTGYGPHPIQREYSIIHITPHTPALLHTYIHTHAYIHEGSALSRTLQEIAAEEAIRRQHFDAAVARSQQKDTTSTDQVYIHTYINTYIHTYLRPNHSTFPTLIEPVP